MRFRLGLLTGFAAGYVLGSKAGQERYEEIREGFNRLMGTEPAQQLQAEVRDAAGRAGALIEEKASDGLAKASDGLSKAGDKVNEKVSELVGSENGNSTNGGGSATTPGSQP